MTTHADKPAAAYRNPAVRDLAWACFSEPVLHCAELPRPPFALGNCVLPLTRARLAWLRELDRQPQALLDHLSQRPASRLGLYFESLWHFLLARDPELELVAHNLPVRDAGRTIGEFDCLYYCYRRQAHVHLELAVKFYLQRTGSDGSQWADWVGPNREDRLDRKLDRLLGHQLRLGEHPAARRSLAEFGITRLERELEIKGRLFRSPGASGTWPAGCRGDGQAAWHCSIDSLAGALPPAAICLPLERSQWLAPVEGAMDRSLDLAALVKLLREKLRREDRPQLVARLDPLGSETARFFVTPGDWEAPR